jgi:hypothetical protein
MTNINNDIQYNTLAKLFTPSRHISSNLLECIVTYVDKPTTNKTNEIKLPDETIEMLHGLMNEADKILDKIDEDEISDIKTLMNDEDEISDIKTLMEDEDKTSDKIILMEDEDKTSDKITLIEAEEETSDKITLIEAEEETPDETPPLMELITEAKRLEILFAEIDEDKTLDEIKLFADKNETLDKISYKINDDGLYEVNEDGTFDKVNEDGTFDEIHENIEILDENIEILDENETSNTVKQKRTKSKFWTNDDPTIQDEHMDTALSEISISIQELKAYMLDKDNFKPDQKSIMKYFDSYTTFDQVCRYIDANKSDPYQHLASIMTENANRLVKPNNRNKSYSKNYYSYEPYNRKTHDSDSSDDDEEVMIRPTKLITSEHRSRYNYDGTIDDLQTTYKEITPEMSADRKLFPLPKPSRSRITMHEFLKYPEYDEEQYTNSGEIMEISTETNNEGEDELICPITTEPIKHLAMTCYGHVYEEEEIREWMQDNDLDPISGRYLYTKTLITHGIDRKNIRKSQKKIRDMMMLLHNYPVSLLYPEQLVKEVNCIKSKINTLSDDDTSKWQKYSASKLYYFRNPETNKSGFPEKYQIDKYDKDPRPEGTGHGFEYVNLSCTCYNKHQHNNQIFKSTSFNGSNLRNNVFVQSTFSRATWVGADISGCVFLGCTILGEEVNFAGAISDSETQFMDCRIEDIGDWSMQTIPEMVELALKHRLLTTPFQVLSVGSFD